MGAGAQCSTFDSGAPVIFPSTSQIFLFHLPFRPQLDIFLELTGRFGISKKQGHAQHCCSSNICLGLHVFLLLLSLFSRRSSTGRSIMTAASEGGGNINSAVQPQGSALNLHCSVFWRLRTIQYDMMMTTNPLSPLLSVCSGDEEPAGRR